MRSEGRRVHSDEAKTLGDVNQESNVHHGAS